MKNNIKLSITFVIILILLPVLIITDFVFAQTLTAQLKGKILLQVEQNGEAWYVNPADEKRYYMGRPADAFNLMRGLGIGITNENLEKIQIVDANLSGTDSDNDGLSDMIEDAIGSDKNKSDSDGDGYDDKSEILNGYNPNGSGKLNLDINFANNQKGKILLQVEAHGEAWYINPDDGKRYFLGRPADAFSVMRSLGLGIKDSDLEKIVQFTSLEQTRLSDILELGISLSKDSYEMGELVEGEYLMKYDGEPFRGIVLTTYEREEIGEVQCGIILRNMVEDIDFSANKINYLRSKFTAFKLDELGNFDTTDYFYEEGTYKYGIHVYDCSYVEEELNKEDCGGELRDFVGCDALLSILSVKSTFKSVVVEGGENPSECETSDDCTELCDGCEDGTQRCEQSSEVCIDCFMDSQCKSGYKCEDNTCISE